MFPSLPEDEQPDEGFLADLDHNYARALQWWAQNHPNPDEPVLLTATGDRLTPDELAEAVARRTERGLKDLEVLHHYARMRGRSEAMGIVQRLVAAADDAAQRRRP